MQYLGWLQLSSPDAHPPERADQRNPRWSPLPPPGRWSPQPPCRWCLQCTGPGEAPGVGEGIPLGQTNIAGGCSAFLIGDTSSYMVDFPASYVSLPECIGFFWGGEHVHGKMCLFAGLRFVQEFWWSIDTCWRILNSWGLHRDNCILLLDETDQSFMFPGVFSEIATKKVTAYNYITLVSNFLLQKGVGAVDSCKRNPTT